MHSDQKHFSLQFCVGSWVPAVLTRGGQGHSTIVEPGQQFWLQDQEGVVDWQGYMVCVPVESF